MTPTSPSKLSGTAMLLVATSCTISCAPPKKRLSELSAVNLVVVVRNPPESDKTRAIVFLELGAQPPSCLTLRDGVSLKLGGADVPMFAAGGKLGDVFSRSGPTCFDASFRSIAPVSPKRTDVEVVEGSKRLRAEFDGLGLERTIAVEGPLVAGSRTSISWMPASDDLDGAYVMVAFEYDDKAKSRWLVDAESRKPGEPLRFTVPTTAPSGRGTLSMALGDFPRVRVRALRCEGASECRASVDLRRGEPSVGALVR